MADLREILNTAIFWSAWIIIPFLMEIVPSIASLFLLWHRRRKEKKKPADPAIWPEVSVIIPVYNSEDTLYACVSSVAESHYPDEAVRIFMVNNGSTDNSFHVYEKCQKDFPDIHMQWLNSEQGKSRALNEALYNTAGKYIVNIDSDGVLDPDALANLVRKFEGKPDLNVVTGTILTNYKKIHEYRKPGARLLRNCEFMEYAETFLAGRSYSSETNTLYTISGAFSAFRKSAVLNSRMYNTSTVGEDTHMTFQMRYLRHEKVEICENAIFYVDPIESLNKLYVQRQRWQRGALEVAEMFPDESMHLSRMFTDPGVHSLVYDHTFAFPRLIWYLALILLTCLNYSGMMVIYAFLLIFALYILSGYFYFFSIQRFLKFRPEIRSYYVRHWWVVALLPFYNLMTFFFRIAGIINSINTTSTWRTKDFHDEGTAFQKALKDDGEQLHQKMSAVYKTFNETEGKDENPIKIRNITAVLCCVVIVAIGIALFCVLSRQSGFQNMVLNSGFSSGR